MGHDHGRATATGRHRGRLTAVLVMTLVVMVAEVVGALVSGSLALLADAGHMLTDASGLGLALVASVLAARPATGRRSFGLARAEVLAAATNALLLLGVAAFVLVEGVRRLVDPQPVAAGPMLVAALAGLVANVVGLRLLHAGSGESLNVRGAYLEVLADLLGSVAVVVAALVVALTGWVRADAVVSLGIGLLVVPRALALLRDTLDVLLESTPRGVDLEDVRAHVLSAEGVLDVHDVHVWTLTGGLPVMSAHVVVAEDALDRAGSGRVLDALGACLADHFDVEHSTFQLEPAGHAAHEGARHA
ncbi:cation diffusion facilitator family transporter [Pseudokineococcus marinus]|uniref:Cation transporter n=1 Tax=Pseudokineococcus marinus TaxID=351215 RepID=A0A849BQC0_9ACTN|nr:cation diffusion facilitator family transporter [Pseudokineococcus marinus]NNH23022.1 cation transporter [Pseudokineococcus marinus]